MNLNNKRSYTLQHLSGLIAICLGLALVGYVSYLVTAQYRSQVALQNSGLQQLTIDSEKRALALSYFYSERVADLKNIAQGRELSAYFENKALGMSLQYGLQASLQTLDDAVDHLRATKLLNKAPIFDRIVLVDSTGHLLVDSRPEESMADGPLNPAALLTTQALGSTIQCEKSGKVTWIKVSLPFFFKQKYAGQIIGWIPSARVYDFFIGDDSHPTTNPVAFVCNEHYIHVPEAAKKFIPIGQESIPAGTTPGEAFRYLPADSKQASDGVYAVLTPIAGTPCSLLTFLPEAGKNDFNSPRKLIYTTGGIAIFILGGMFIALRLNTRNVVLSVRLEEITLREQAIAEKNRQLEIESAERKKAEEEVRRLNSDLEERVRQRTLELEASNRELEEFCYSISHDLRGHLTRLDGYSSALMEDSADPDHLLQQQYAERINHSTRQLKETIDALLKLTKLTRDAITYQNIDLSSMVGSVAEELRNSQPSRNTEFVIASGATVNGDPRLLQLVVENLLGNAWKFTEHKPESRIEFGISEIDGQTVYFIRDNGAGFNMGYANKLFKPFQSVHDQSRYPGTGLGLASAQRIIQRHGGIIWAEGIPDKGATFYFTL